MTRMLIDELEKQLEKTKRLKLGIKKKLRKSLSWYKSIIEHRDPEYFERDKK